MEGTPAPRVALPIPSQRPTSLQPDHSFLSRSCPTDAMDNTYPPLEASTSSGGSFGLIHSLGTSPSNMEEQSRPTRPRVANRIVSSPVLPQRRRNSSSRTRNGTIFASFNRPGSSGREWSVFEQRMENERQLRTRSILRESVTESVVLSPFQQTTDLAIRSESPVTGAPSLRRVTVEDGHESDEASTVGYDSESDSEDSSQPSSPLSPPLPQKQRWYSKWKPQPLTPLQRNILKCAVAYFVGSLFTFNLTLSSLITSVISTEDERAPSRSGHMVATV